MTPHQRQVAERYLAEEGRRREAIVVALSGAHAYGFPSPDSDLDLKGIHVVPTRALLGLNPDARPIERANVIEGVEIDYSSHEIGQVLAGILKGNGNFVERVLGALLLVKSPTLEGLKPLVRGTLSRRVHHHYQGFAVAQRREAHTTRRAKKVLYVLRTTLTGTHLLRTSELVTDVTTLAPIYGFDLADLLEAKARAEREPLDEVTYARAVSRMDRAFEVLADALASSVLPEEPANVADVDAWLVQERLRRA